MDKISGRDRRQAIIDNLLDRPYRSARESIDPVDQEIKGKKYTIVATLIDDGDFGNAVALASHTIKDRPNLKCVVGLFNLNTPALLKALEQANQLGKIKVIGFDAAEETQRGLENGNVDAAILQNQYGCGYEAVRVLADSARGMNQDRAFGDMLLTCTVLTKDTMENMRQNGRLRPLKAK